MENKKKVKPVTWSKLKPTRKGLVMLFGIVGVVTTSTLIAAAMAVFIGPIPATVVFLMITSLGVMMLVTPDGSKIKVEEDKRLAFIRGQELVELVAKLGETEEGTVQRMEVENKLFAASTLMQK